jgi:hypothetical protein
MYDEGRNTDETREGLTSQARCDAARRVKLLRSTMGMGSRGRANPGSCGGNWRTSERKFARTSPHPWAEANSTRCLIQPCNSRGRLPVPAPWSPGSKRPKASHCIPNVANAPICS